MLVDLRFDGKYVVVVGGGAEGYRKTLNFVDLGAKILVASKSFSSGIRNLQRLNKVSLLETTVVDAEAFVNDLTPKPDLLVAVTDDYTLNAQLVKHAKSAGCMVYAVDDPSISDFAFPALAKIGEVRIAISTSGKSPAMARTLRQRIEKTITEDYLQQIKLQTCARTLLKQRTSNQQVRKQILYKLLRNEQVNQLLKEKNYDEAQDLMMKLVEKWIEAPVNLNLKEVERT